VPDFLPLLRHLHLRFARSRVLCRNHAHNLVSELPEESTLEQFSCIITNYVPDGTPFDGDLTLTDSVGDKEILDIDMLRALAARSLAILLQKHGTLVILEHHIVIDLIPLAIHEVAGPAHGWHVIIHANNLGVSRGPSVEFLFGATHDGKSAAQREASSRVSSHVGVDRKCRMNPPLQNTTSVGTQDQRQRARASDVLHEVDQLSRIILVGCPHSRRQECNGGAGVRSCSFGSIQHFSYQVVELHSFLSWQFLRSLIHLE